MTDSTTTDQRSPEEIERDIRATQAEMSQTVRQIENELTPRNILDALLDKAGQSGVDSDYLIDTARRNPLALGMIAIGGLWLVSDADARPSALKISTGRGKSTETDQSSYEGWHPDHRSYVEHMSRCERQPDEDDMAYRRRRDHSRASYFMLEQGHDEDESAFRQRLDEATEKMRRSRERMGERAQAFAGQTRDRSRQMIGDARGFYSDNPLLGGIAAAFVGAVLGTALPATRTEEEYVGSLGEQAIGAAGAKMRQAGEQVRQSKDTMLDRVEDRLAESPQSARGEQEQPVQQV
jgi:ElaB/YqjD/DUF883 family membrane-anchored ribosome-binding protein